MGLASIAATAVHFFAAGIALRKMLVALGVGAVDHFMGNRAAIIAGRNYHGVHVIYINRLAVIVNITFAFKILSAGFLAIFNNTAMQLVNIFKSLVQQQCRCLFAFDAAGAVG